MSEEAKPKVCAFCGKEFIPYDNHASFRFCSKECARMGDHSQYNKVKLKKNRKCHGCGKPTNNYYCAKCWAKRGRYIDSEAGIDDNMIFY